MELRKNKILWNKNKKDTGLSIPNIPIKNINLKASKDKLKIYQENKTHQANSIFKRIQCLYKKNRNYMKHH